MTGTVNHATTWGDWALLMINSPPFIGSLLGALVAGGGFYFAYSQLKHARTQIQQAADRHDEEMIWRRSEFIRKLLSDMSNDPKVALIFRILDWRDGPALIPEDLRPFFEEDPLAGGGSTRIMTINWDRFVKALPIVKEEGWTAPDLYTYRTCFDSFLSFIQQTMDDLRTANIEKFRFADLTFYCYRIVHPKNGNRKDDAHARDVFRDYILEYYNEGTYDYILECAKFYKEYFIDDLPSSANRNEPPLKAVAQA